MDMVINAAYLMRMHFVLAADPANVFPNASFDFRTDPIDAVLSAKNDVQVDLGVGVGHGDVEPPVFSNVAKATSILIPQFRGLKPTATIARPLCGQNRIGSAPPRSWRLL